MPTIGQRAAEDSRAFCRAGLAPAETQAFDGGGKPPPYIVFFGVIQMKTVLITGGSRGIGAAAAAQFAARGDRVFFLYEKEHEKARAVAEKTGATAICCDVAKADSVKDAFTQIGDVDILVCNAGIAQVGLMIDLPEAEWDRLFDVNVKGVYLCINEAMPGFLKKQAGCIVTVSSMWGQVGASCEAAYSATKGAVIALTKALAKELGPSGIRVNCVAPGVILTDMCADVEPEILDGFVQETPVGRNGLPEDVAKAIVYLADADFVTGQVLPVNGGYII